MKLTNEQIKSIIIAICTLVTTLASIIWYTACTTSVSVSKNNTNSSHSVEQTTTSTVDSVYLDVSPGINPLK